MAKKTNAVRLVEQAKIPCREHFYEYDENDLSGTHVAEQIGLVKLIKFNTRQSAHNSYMGGNAFEALVGAIYLDRGYEYCKFFMEHRIIGTYLDLNKVSRKEVNFKSKLIEWTQKNKVEITFDLIDQSYDEFNSPVFESEVLIEGIHACKGKGYSKKESQQIASHETLNRIKKDSAFLESIFAAKAKREEPKEMSDMSKSVEEETPMVEIEMPRRSDDMEDIIRAAEEGKVCGRSAVCHCFCAG